MYIDKDDVIYVADSESRDGRTNTGQLTLPQTGYGYNPGAQRGIRIGSAADGSVRYFIPDACPYPYPSGSSMAEGSTVRIFSATSGNFWGTDARWAADQLQLSAVWRICLKSTPAVAPACRQD
jgi:hypothetical protein